MRLSYIISKILKKMHIPAIKYCNIHYTSKVGSFSHLLDVKMDKYSYVGNNCTVIDAEIGRYCSIADNVIIGGGSHPIDWVSSSPVFLSGKNIMRKNFSEHAYNPTKRTIIKNDIWIGNNCLIKSGVTIDNGAVIGMGAVVTKNVGAYEIWGGNPAKLIRKRFSDEYIVSLIDSEWWLWSDEKIKKHASLMTSKEGFIKNLRDMKA